ncbi:hypothetical protein LOK49_LG12G02912 [Camellia lanceoleosa]|uniref:Uncharacterized protein n=1 Tax=Camellia lanceoleosa TaxID=1840588 RepID=A0ACC0FSG7_9ERIC|nr:hypothetical protein LOK49_LG12G02912 [Camellia lanceoleosa]
MVTMCVNNKRDCQDCLTVASANIKICPPNADGRVIDAVVFLDTRILPSLLITRQLISTPFMEEEEAQARRMPLLEE